MRVITWNVHKGKGGMLGRAPRMPELVASLVERSPDLVLCQEVFRSAMPGKAGQELQFAHGLGMSASYSPNAQYRKGDHGNATFSVLAPAQSHNHDLSLTRLEKRGVLHTEQTIRDRPVHVFNTHLSLTTRQRRLQIQSIAQFINRRCYVNDAVILGGDFNDWTGRLDSFVRSECRLGGGLKVFQGRGHKSWPNFGPVFALDRIYFRGLDLRSAQVLDGAHWRRLSDHLPLEFEFET